MVFKPLSESEPLHLISPEVWRIEVGQRPKSFDVLELRAGENRIFHTEIYLAQNAVSELIQIVDVPATARVEIYFKVNVDESAVWRHVMVIRGEGEVMVHRLVTLTEASAQTELVCLGRGLGSGAVHVSDEVVSLAADTQGKIQTRLSLRDQARSWVRARMIANEHSIQTQLHERIDQLLLSDSVRAAVIPELEVKTDQVRCGHAATTSRPDTNLLFYLMSRGLSEERATDLLEDGFLKEYLSVLPQSIQTEAFRVIWR